jgi:hypothetical protein
MGSPVRSTGVRPLLGGARKEPGVVYTQMVVHKEPPSVAESVSVY